MRQLMSLRLRSSSRLDTIESMLSSFSDSSSSRRQITLILYLFRLVCLLTLSPVPVLQMTML